MNQMQVNTSSWHYKLYRLSYALWSDTPPNNSNLCQYAHRVFLFLPLTVILYTGLLLLVLILADLFVFSVFHHPWAYLSAFGIIAAIFGFAWFASSDTAKLIKSWVDAKTKGICPTIEFRRK